MSVRTEKKVATCGSETCIKSVRSLKRRLKARELEVEELQGQVAELAAKLEKERVTHRAKSRIQRNELKAANESCVRLTNELNTAQSALRVLKSSGEEKDKIIDRQKRSLEAANLLVLSGKCKATEISNAYPGLHGRFVDSMVEQGPVFVREVRG